MKSRRDNEYSRIARTEVRESIRRSNIEHFNKNPFFKIDLSNISNSHHVKDMRVPDEGEVAEEGDDRCGIIKTSSKINLKSNLEEEIKSINPPEIKERIQKIQELDFKKMIALETCIGEKCVIQKDESCEEPFFEGEEEEVRILKSGLEYKNRMNPTMQKDFTEMLDIPAVTEQDLNGKQIKLDRKDRKKKTAKVLLLGLNKTLVYFTEEKPQDYNKEWQEIIVKAHNGSQEIYYARLRPYAKELLAAVNGFMEVIIFTSEAEDLAKIITNKLVDPENKYIDHILTKDHCLNKNGKIIKDFRIIGNRNHDKMVMVDSSIISFSSQIDNGILIPPYYGKEEDSSLLPVIDFLKKNFNSADIKKEIKNTFMINDLYKVFLINENR